MRARMAQQLPMGPDIHRAVHVVEIAHLMASRDLGRTMAALQVRRGELDELHRSIDQSSQDLARLRLHLMADLSNPVTYVAGIELVADVHRQLTGLRYRRDRIEDDLTQKKHEFRSIWRRVDMLEKQRLQLQGKLMDVTERRADVEAANAWGSQRRIPGGVGR